MTKKNQKKSSGGVISVLFDRQNVILFAFLILLIPIYYFLYKAYIPRVNAFGCFDDCFNFLGGYFINEGKVIYRDFFFNHQFLPAYISAFIQQIFNPINIYELVLRHRQSLLLFSFVLNFLLVFRFRFIGFAFVLLYEFSKFYVFGDRFLAEAFIVYPLVYMFGIFWYVWEQKKTYVFDYVFVAIGTWFVLFMREPYSLVALLLFFLIFLRKPFGTQKKFLFGFFVVITIFSILTQSIPDYFFNVVTLNAHFADLSGSTTDNVIIGIFKIFLYPFYLFFGGEWNVFRYFLLGINVLFLVFTGVTLITHKKWKLIVILFLILGFANFRYTPPGKVFYEAFHMTVWFGMFLFATLLLFQNISTVKLVKVGGTVVFVGLFLFITFSPTSYLKDRFDSHSEFLTNYGHYNQIGEVAQSLSNSNTTLYVDGFDDLIIWQAKLPSPYKYTWYTSFMQSVPRYYEARIEMFQKNPPDLYYGTCPKEQNPRLTLPEFVKNRYSRLQSNGRPTCFYIKKELVPRITEDQWQKVKTMLYDKPSL